MTIRFDPALPWAVIAALAAVMLAAAGWAWWRGLRGWPWRALAGAALAAWLAGPAVERATRQGLDDIVVLLDDRSASQTLPGRAAQTDAAIAALSAQIAALPATRLHRVSVGDDAQGTLLGAGLVRALAGVPAARLAGVIAVTDGLAHDAGALPEGLPAPFHALLTGGADDWDRRLVIETAPAFGLIGQPATIRLRIVDEGAVPPEVAHRPVGLRIRVDGGAAMLASVPPGVPFDLPVTPDHAGANVVELAIDAVPGELTARNNAAALTITGVRDRLRVLLVSGEPHAGERTWRNLLKSDAGVDLIHFTILRPPEAFDPTPPDEVALIAFPTRELFSERIDDFDLIILDRYRVRGILPPEYFGNIARYVERGGAVLVSQGPEAAGYEGLHLTALGRILPGQPTGRVIDAPFRPTLSDAGARHPVTAALPGADGWGRWLRMIGLDVARGQVVMTGAGGQPLLILDRVGKGRVAQLASDQVWLWARGFEGGGPQLELLRRIAHWSMHEPQLEEESLTAEVTPGPALAITRRSMAPAAGPVAVTAPDGGVAQVALAPMGPGVFGASVAADQQGLYRLRDGDLVRVVAVGPAAPREFARTVARPDALAPLAEATGGAVMRLSDAIPDLRAVAAGRAAHGAGVAGPWLGVTPRGADTVTGLSRHALAPGWAWLCVIAGAALAAWLAEGRRRGLS